MASASVPATPVGDIATWESSRTASGEGPLLTPDLVALAQSGASVSLASLTAEGRPLVAMGCACRVRADGFMRILLSQPANLDFLDAVEAGRPVAATFTRAQDHRAFQVKAASAKLRSACSDDLPEIDRQTTLLRDGLIEIGFSSDLAAGFVGFDPDNLMALELMPERVFTQTPGPGAGAELVR